MGICLDRNARYWSTPGGSRQRRPSSDRPDTLPPLQLPIIFHQKIPQNFAKKKTFSICSATKLAVTSRVSSHQILSGSPIYPKIAPHKFPPFPIDPKIGPSDQRMFGRRVFTYKIWWAHFGLNSGANVLSVCCWLSPFLSLYWQQRL